jgi:NADPH-dependent ferric siderophore reductase
VSAVAATSVRRTASHAVTVAAIVALTPRMRRLTLAGPSLAGLDVTPAQDIELVLPDGYGHQVKRRYTIRSARPSRAELDVDLLLHPHGPGGRWASTVAVGDELMFFGPRGHLELRSAGWHLFIADEAGLPAVASILESLPAGERAVVLAEVGDGSDRVPLVRPAAETDLRWLIRAGRPPGTVTLFERELDGLHAAAPAGRAYLLGESRAMVALRPHIVALGIPGDHSYVKGYWNLGRGAALIPS